MAASMAWIWVASSPSSLPAAVVMLTLLALPASSAPFCIAMKNGLVAVLVIRVTANGSPPPPPLDWPEGSAEPPQADRASTVAAVRVSPVTRRCRALDGECMEVLSIASHRRPGDNGVKGYV